MKYDLLCLTRCHHRAEGLTRVADLILKELPDAGVRTCLVLAPDPLATPEVKQVAGRLGQDPNVVLHCPALPVLSSRHGQRWIQTLNEMCDAFDQRGHEAPWLFDFDDDAVFSPGWEEKLPALLADESMDVYEAISLFLWDDAEEQVNVLQHHWSPRLGRYRAGARRSLDRELHVVDFVQASIEKGGRMKKMPWYLLDFGSATEADRQACFRACARAGKLDPYTKAYIRPPLLRPLADILREFPHPGDFQMWQERVLNGSVTVA